MKNQWRYVIIFLIVSSFGFTEQDQVMPPFYTKAAEHWADSVLSTLTPNERIAQLIMISAWSNKDSTHIKEIQKEITDWGIGGLIFFQGGPVRQALLTNSYQSISKVPLMIGIDGEWGLSMRLDSTVRFPRQMTLSAIPGDSAAWQMGSEIARQCKRMGIHVNFAPDADINTNPLNPVIGSRSFGDEREEVTRKAMLYMQALQAQHVLANGKHFPGHGNADSDSHLTLPTIYQSREALDSVELYPFRKMIANGLGSIMVAHLEVPALDSTPALPSTLSSPIVTGLLREKMQFKGLIFTDALIMKGVSACYKPGVLDRKALLAGNDVLLQSEDVHKAIDEIRLAVEAGEITQEEIDKRAKKVLMAKYWCGLGNYHPIDTTNLISDLNTPAAQILGRELFSKAITVLSGRDSLLPFVSAKKIKIASLVVGDKKDNSFQQMLGKYAPVDCFALDKDATTSVCDAMFHFLANYDLVILSLHGTTMKAQASFGMTEGEKQFIDTILKSYHTLFVDFGNAYTLSMIRNLKLARASILSYEDFPLMHELTAQMIMGAGTSSGKLPVKLEGIFPRKWGTVSTGGIRLLHALPEEAGMSSRELQAIDTIVNEGILAGAMPGCQVLVARRGKIIYEKAFGKQTFDSDTVKTDDLYDIASLTKIMATVLATMKLSEEGKIDVNQPLSKYLTKLKNSDKKNLTIREIMAHQAGLQSWEQFWKRALKGTELSDKYFRRTSSHDFPLQVADSLYSRKEISDSIFNWIQHSELGPRGKYVYSDFGPILMKFLVEKISGKPFTQYLAENFYQPLQLPVLGFSPQERFPLSRIPPTEFDSAFRKQLVHGHVHDPASAMMGGVSGNAGVFSDANDVAVIMQMLLNGGVYGGIRFLEKSTITQFTTQQFPENHNRRGLLFDRPETDPQKPSPCATVVSPFTFGHQGFTGTDRKSVV